MCLKIYLQKTGQISTYTLFPLSVAKTVLTSGVKQPCRPWTYLSSSILNVCRVKENVLNILLREQHAWIQWQFDNTSFFSAQCSISYSLMVSHSWFKDIDSGPSLILQEDTPPSRCHRPQAVLEISPAPADSSNSPPLAQGCLNTNKHGVT